MAAANTYTNNTKEISLIPNVTRRHIWAGKDDRSVLNRDDSIAFEIKYLQIVRFKIYMAEKLSYIEYLISVVNDHDEGVHGIADPTSRENHSDSENHD